MGGEGEGGEPRFCSDYGPNIVSTATGNGFAPAGLIWIGLDSPSRGRRTRKIGVKKERWYDHKKVMQGSTDLQKKGTKEKFAEGSNTKIPSFHLFPALGKEFETGPFEGEDRERWRS